MTDFPTYRLNSDAGSHRLASLEYIVLACVGFAPLALPLALGWPASGTAVRALPLTVYAAGTLAIWIVLRRDYPHPRLGACNVITHLRLTIVALLTAPLALAEIGTEIAWSIFALAVAAFALDGIDGRLARRSGLVSDFGARFDVEVDSALALLLALLAWRMGEAGPWILLLGLPRYAFVAAAWALPWLASPLPERPGRKVACALQIGTLIALLAPPVGGPWAAGAALVATAVVLTSFAVDIAWLARRRSAA